MNKFIVISQSPPGEISAGHFLGSFPGDAAQSALEAEGEGGGSPVASSWKIPETSRFSMPRGCGSQERATGEG